MFVNGLQMPKRMLFLCLRYQKKKDFQFLENPLFVGGAWQIRTADLLPVKQAL
jgi:hypothetical protein